MRASVIIVAYNSRAYLQACLASVCESIGIDDEIIVVDNSSTDGSPEFVAERFPEVRLIRSANVGYAGGNNRGAEAARGEFLVFLNPDIVVQPGAIDALLDGLSDDGVGLTTARIVYQNQPELINACGNTVHYTGLAYCRGIGQRAAGFDDSSDVDAVSGAAFAIRSAVFVALGGFDEQFFLYVEDTDLSWRARLAGYRCRYVASAVIEHAYRPDFTAAKSFYLDRNRHMMLLKCLSWPSYLRLLPGLLLSEAVTLGFFALRGFWTVKPQVYAALWRSRHNIWHARRQTQALRKRSDGEIIGQLTHRLELGQLAGRTLAAVAEAVLHPAFWVARRLFVGGVA